MALLIRPTNNTMDQSSKRSRRSWSTIAASHDPYASTSSLLSSTQDINDPTSLISGGGKIRSRPSLGGLNRLKSSKSKRQSVPALSTNSILRRSSNKKRVSSSSREELSREGHVKALPTNCQSTPLICNRTSDNKSSASQQRVCFEDDPSTRDDAELDVHNEQWDEIIRPKRPIDTSPSLSNNLTTATIIGTAKEVPLKFDKHPKTATTLTTSSRLPKLMLSSATPFFGKKFKRMEEESSQPIPINRTFPTPQETEDETKEADETLHYDMATWQMYTRIAQARRRKAISSQSRDANCSSGASTAAARHGMMMQDNRHSYVSNEEEEVPQANKEEEDIGVFAFDL